MFARRLARTILAVAICNGLCFELYGEPLEGPPESKGTTKSEEPPAPGPELLKYTPEQIQAAYEGKEMPEAVAMYLVIAQGGQLDGSGGWFA